MKKVRQIHQGWYSITPEEISKHIARRTSEIFGECNILDAFCGVGGNTIQFAKKAKQVTACDIDKMKIDYGKNNSRIYKVFDKIDFVLTDFLELDPMIAEVDVVFLSPPWGGTGYNLLQKYTLSYIFPSFHKIMEKALEFSNNLIWFLPRNTDIDELCKEMSYYALKLGYPGEIRFEIEKIKYNNSISVIVVYFGRFVNVSNYQLEQTITSLELSSLIEHNLIYGQSQVYQKLLLTQAISQLGCEPFLNLFKNGRPRKTLGWQLKRVQEQVGDEVWMTIKKRVSQKKR